VAGGSLARASPGRRPETHDPLATIEAHRPRNLDWKRSAALLYGDWGTSKAYVIGLAFVAAGFSSFPIILAVCVLTACVAYNYTIVCRSFPDGGGVYSAAREQSRALAAVGALLLIANFLVTAALSGWAAMSYFGVPKDMIGYATMGVIVALGVVNYFGPKHSGSLAVWMAIPTVCVVVLIILFALPYLRVDGLEGMNLGFKKTWVAFVGVILALSGVEAIANMTGVMKLDPGSSDDEPKVGKTASRSLFVVAIEVVFGTLLLGWAMLSVPHSFGPQMIDRKEDMIRFLGEHYSGLLFGPAGGAIFGVVVGLVFGVLLLSAVNTAILALIGVLYMMARDGEMPRQLTKLNRNGVPALPLVIATGLPVLVLAVMRDFEALAGLYAIGVVGAITVNLGSCTLNRRLHMHWWERVVMGLTFAVLLAVELTIAKTNPDALFFAMCVLIVGLGVRAYSLKLSGLETVTVSSKVADMVKSETIDALQTQVQEGGKILVAARGLTPVLKFAMDEAALRKSSLCVLFVKEVSVFLAGAPSELRKTRWQDDEDASRIMAVMQATGQARGVNVVPLYAVSDDPAATILDLSATLGVDMLILGASNRQGLTKVLKGDIAARVAHGLPEEIHLVICG